MRNLPLVLWLLAVMLGLNVSYSRTAEPTREGVEFFEKKIRPVLVEHCYKCHSAEAKKSKGGLVVDTRQGLLDGGETGPAVVPGNPIRSLLLKALTHDGLKMPNGTTKLPGTVIADFETWIKLGAPDPRTGKSVARKGIDYDEGRKHWAYLPVPSPRLPGVQKSEWPAVDLDQFILAAIEKKGLTPAPDSLPHAWLRRLSFDLTGLPPTVDEVEAFEIAVRAKPKAAIEEVVDRLLASPRFGEHWARHWLDGVRFNAEIASMEHYRDWVVRAFNADLPYDRFLAMQLAGDLLPASDDARERADRVFATQMAVLNLKEMDPIEGTLEVLGQQVLGVSINCAKCHDHKFDAYSQQDYYALAGIFTSSSLGAGKKGIEDKVAVPGQPELTVLAVTEGKAADTNLLVRGEKNQAGPVVPRRFPVVLAGDQQTPIGQRTKLSGRLELAKWIADPAHPLTARVMVNRVWMRLFGQGIVRTPNDFGLAGEPPVNQELLDHLAARFAGEFKWSVKKLVRELVMSRTYRQGAGNAPARAAGPENRFFAHAQVRRLSYEQTVDALSFVAGVLSFDIPARGKGPAPYPRFGGGKDAAPTAYRALYHDDKALRTLFDGADPELLTEKREESVTAPQLLFFLNNPQVVALAGKVAARVKSAPATDHVSATYLLLFGRTPTDRERARASAFLQGNSLERFCHVLLASSEFNYLE